MLYILSHLILTTVIQGKNNHFYFYNLKMWLMTMMLIALDHRLFSVRAGIQTHFHISKAKMLFFSTHHILKIKDVFVHVHSLVLKALNNVQIEFKYFHNQQD